MANYKRRKPRRHVRCTLCTPHRDGNSKKNEGYRSKRRPDEIEEEWARRSVDAADAEGGDPITLEELHQQRKS